MSWKNIIVPSSALVYLYILVTEWVDLSPWNDVTASTSAQKLSGSLVNALPFGLLILAFVLDLSWLKWISVGLFVIWLGVHFVWWWVPYLFGASEAHMQSYNLYFSGAYKFLPARGGNPIPTAQYVVMQALTLANTIVAFVALMKSRML